ncbi:MAG: NAD(P)H-dependent oxidoreductase [Balneolaceae bacterium]|nr:NAD(P)H-dependent oxidoreductase [Balneolaceae bacterium]MBO6544881.1 NAD(P)H-dependent oxidoreductase [Balneolaceae bacterium]MBO6646277.1 NAD(P)H-dependent oxidoreductase [Balneolaceae bacterium]
MNLKIISGTDMPGSKCLEVANYLSGLYQKVGVKADIIDMTDFPLADVVGGKYMDEIPSIIKFRKPVIEADALLFVIPEYNGSFPGILKIFIDYLPYPSALAEKPIAYVGIAGGAFGGLRPVEQFQMVANYLNAHQYPERVFISRVQNMFDPKTGIKDEFQQKLLEAQTEGFVKFVEALIN